MAHDCRCALVRFTPVAHTAREMVLKTIAYESRLYFRAFVVSAEIADATMLLSVRDLKVAVRYFLTHRAGSSSFAALDKNGKYRPSLESKKYR
ncbi:hypothetical protein TNCV_20441 [Trichonephila clavipes]|uniref:Uncharacterized protein n=1 Tax=Trichonephila clavipes TaxID=2585209 RepID=A0A8X6UZC7_TRICX|nr:hypothetical protein TNCV_20441 [Trichonephila clavipes]